MEDGDVSMSSVDNRIVNLQFNNKEFESNVATSMKTLDELKKKLEITSDTDVDNINEAFNTLAGTTLGNVASSVSSLADRFSTLGIIGMQVISNITNSAMNLASTLTNAIAIDPIKDGLAEYETQIGSIQTILANTSSKGTDLYEVNEALNELNTYADKTIYNFTQMTQNIGRFTAAGVDLETSVNSIQGIANLAAVSGSTATQASTAMYQLSQAIAAGKVQLMDWNSVVNAGMGGEVFQNALIRTSEHLQTGAKQAIETYGSFRESLTNGAWLTTEVLTETLEQFALAVDTTEDYESAIASLVEEGYTQEEAKEIADMAKTASDAATKVKTFSQLIDTLKEALGSGWTSSWELMIGDYNEAKEVWTGVSDKLSNMISESATKRNDFLTRGLSSGWKQLLHEGIPSEKLFAATTEEVAKEYGVAIDDILEANDNSLSQSFKDGWATSEIMTESLNRFTDEVNNMSDAELKSAGITATQRDELNALNDAVNNGSINMQTYVNKFTALSGRENVISGLGTAFDSLVSVLSTVKSSFDKIFPPMTSDDLYRITQEFKSWTEALTPTETTLSNISRIADGAFSAIKMVLQVVKEVASGVVKVVTEGLKPLWNLLGDLALQLADWFTKTAQSFDTSGINQFFIDLTTTLSGDIQGLINIFSPLATSLWEFGKTIASVGWSALQQITVWISDFLGSFVNSETVVGIINGIAQAVEYLAGIIGGGLKDAVSWAGQNISFRDIFSAAKLSGFLAELEKINSFIDPFVDLIKETFGGDIKEKVDDWRESFNKLTDTIGESLKSMCSLVPTAKVAIIAGSITALALAMEKLGQLSVPQIIKGAGGILSVSYILVQAVKKLEEFRTFGSTKSVLTEMGYMLTLAESCKKMADALVSIGTMSWDQILGGLGGLFGCMQILIYGLKQISGFGYINDTELKMAITLAGSMYIMGKTLQNLAGIPFDQMAISLGGIAGCMYALVKGLQALGGSSGYISATTVWETIVLAGSVYILGQTVKQISELGWEEIARGLAGMGGCLAELVGSLCALNNWGGTNVNSLLNGLGLGAAAFSLIEIGGALKLVCDIPWDQMQNSFIAIGGVFSLLTAMLIGLTVGTGGGVGSILSGLGLDLAAASLLEIAASLNMLRDYDWDDMVVAVGGLSATLTAVAAITTITGLFGLFTFLGGLGLDTVIPTLITVADQLSKLAAYDYDAMCTASQGLCQTLRSIAVITTITGLGGLFTFLGGLGLDSAIPILTSIADQLVKLAPYADTDFTKPVTAIVEALGALAGITTLSGLGSLGGLTTALSDQNLVSVINNLEPIADTLVKLAPYSSEQLTTGVTAISDALTAVSEMFNNGLIHGLVQITSVGAVTDVLENLTNVADALATLAPYGADQLSNGVTQLGSAISTIGESLDTYFVKGISAEVFKNVASGMDSFADAMAKWKNVTIPSGIGTAIGEIGDGVTKFTLSGLGSGALSSVAEPLGTLADSIKKWDGVIIPDNMGTMLGEIGRGCTQFTLGVVGANTIATVAEPLGTLADSAKKWLEVSIPDDLPSKFQRLASGIAAFTFDGLGADGLKSVCDPLASLADSIQKFSNVSISGSAWDLVQGADGNGEGFLSKLASATQAFTLSGVGAGALSEIAEPLGTLANSINQYSQIDFSKLDGDSIEACLQAFARGVKAFDGAEGGSEILKDIGTPMEQIKGAMETLSSLDPEQTLSKLTEFINGINNGFPEITSTLPDNLNTFATSVSDAMTNLATSISDNSTNVSTNLTTFTGTVGSAFQAIVDTANSNVESISSAFSSISSSADGLASAFQTGLDNANQTISNCLATMVNNITGSGQSFYDAASTLAGRFASGISENSQAASDNARTMAEQAATACGDGGYDSAYTAGGYVAQGFADGISAGANAAVNAAAKMGADAIKAAKDASGVASPSKKTYAIARFCVIGAINGLRDNRDSLISATSDLVTGMIQSVGDTADSLSDEMTLTPSIAPVVDISGAGTAFTALRTMIPNRELADFTSNFKAQTVSAAFKGRTEIEDTYRKNILDSNAKTVDAITSLKDDLSAYTTAVANSETAMYLDGKKVASSLAKPMNKAMGTLARQSKL